MYMKGWVMVNAKNRPSVRKKPSETVAVRIQINFIATVKDDVEILSVLGYDKVDGFNADTVKQEYPEACEWLNWKAGNDSY